MGKGKTHRNPNASNPASKKKGKSKEMVVGGRGGNGAQGKGRSKTRRDKPFLIEDPAESERQLAATLKSMGLYVATTIGDGNCMFRALSDQTFGAPTQHSTIRQEICSYILANSSHYSPFIDSDSMGSFESYVDTMRQNGTYGGHLELEAFSRLKKRRIKVVQPGMVYVLRGVDESPGASGEGNEDEGGEEGEEEEVVSERERRRKRREGKRRTKGGDGGDEGGEEDGRDGDADGANAEDSGSGPIYVAYHSWEHYSSLRNVDGPHTGLPKIREKRPEPSSSSQSGSPSDPDPTASASSSTSLIATPEEKLILASIPNAESYSLGDVRKMLKRRGDWESVVEEILEIEERKKEDLERVDRNEAGGGVEGGQDGMAEDEKEIDGEKDQRLPDGASKEGGGADGGEKQGPAPGEIPGGEVKRKRGRPKGSFKVKRGGRTKASSAVPSPGEQDGVDMEIDAEEADPTHLLGGPILNLSTYRSTSPTNSNSTNDSNSTSTTASSVTSSGTNPTTLSAGGDSRDSEGKGSSRRRNRSQSFDDDEDGGGGGSGSGSGGDDEEEKRVKTRPRTRSSASSSPADLAERLKAVGKESEGERTTLSISNVPGSSTKIKISSTRSPTPGTPLTDSKPPSISAKASADAPTTPPMKGKEKRELRKRRKHEAHVAKLRGEGVVTRSASKTRAGGEERLEGFKELYI